MSTKLEQEVSRALDGLASSVQIVGPICTDNHTTYVVTGLADTNEQMTSLCWCILGFLGGIFEVDLSIDSAIGEGAQASDNLIKILRKRVRIGEPLTERQKELNRDPLLQELVSHTLVLIHRGRSILPEWLAEIQACRPPHLSANDPGLDLIAIGADSGSPFPVIGEVKAYEDNPLGGLDKACEKFSQVRRGEYNDEIRAAMRLLDISHRFGKEQLAANIWIDIGRFGALVGHDQDSGFDVNEPCTEPEVLEQDPERLFFITSPYRSMRALFDDLASRLGYLAESLGE